MIRFVDTDVVHFYQPSSLMKPVILAFPYFSGLHHEETFSALDVPLQALGFSRDCRKAPQLSRLRCGSLGQVSAKSRAEHVPNAIFDRRVVYGPSAHAQTPLCRDGAPIIEPPVLLHPRRTKLARKCEMEAAALPMGRRQVQRGCRQKDGWLFSPHQQKEGGKRPCIIMI